MKKTGILVLTMILLCMISSESPARRVHHHDRHRHFVSFGPMFSIMPGYYPSHAWFTIIPVEPTTVNYIQRSADDVPSPQYWYYCTQPQGYYPYVRTCHGSWQTVIPFSPDAD